MQSVIKTGYHTLKNGHDFLIFKNFPASYTKSGKIKVGKSELKNDGIVFDPRREGLHNAPAKLYPLKDIICAVNKNREVVYGKIPKDFSTGFWNLDIYFVPADQTEIKPVRISMKTNERFS